MKLLAIASICVLTFTSVYAVDSTQVVKQFKEELLTQKVDVVSLVSKYGKLADENICDVVKAAITLADADSAKVAAIVEAAIKVNPKKAREIVNTAIAIAPDSHDEIMKTYLKFAPASGVASVSDAKGAKDAKDAKAPLNVANEGAEKPKGNVLNFPGGLGDPGAGPTPGGPGGKGLIPPEEGTPFVSDPVPVTDPAPVTTP